MKGFLKKAKAEFEERILKPDPPSTSHPPAMSQSQQFLSMEGDRPSTIQEPTALDILRYRYHHGTNLGSIYVLERWLHGSMFPEGASGSSELEAVKAWVERIGLEATTRKFEEHWANAVSDADIQWLLNEAKCTTIRLPIGYFDLDPAILLQTPFAPYASVYRRAWASIWTLVKRLRAHSIGTILDLHALPGGANNSDHSGTNSGKTELWVSPTNRDLSLRCCQFLANEVTKGLEIVAIQIVNEAEYRSERLFEFYDDCILAISAFDPTIPVIISDAWDLTTAIEYARRVNVPYPARRTCPVIIDTHFYWCHTPADAAKTPQQIIGEVSDTLNELNGKEGNVIERGAIETLVGEYCCVLSEGSWAKSTGSTPKEELVKQFGQAQSKRWQERTGGSFFWTWKMDWFPGGEWGFAAQSQSRAIAPHPIQNIPWPSIPNLLARAEEKKDERMYHAVEQHISYWDRMTPTVDRREHWRYENGWKVGYSDAMAFFKGRGTEAVQAGNKIGCLEIWVLKRVKESGMTGRSVWEFEQGLRRGIHDFYCILAI